MGNWVSSVAGVKQKVRLDDRMVPLALKSISLTYDLSLSLLATCNPNSCLSFQSMVPKLGAHKVYNCGLRQNVLILGIVSTEISNMEMQSFIQHIWMILVQTSLLVCLGRGRGWWFGFLCV